MKKLRLNLDELKVDSFSPAPEPADGRGTVFAHSTFPTGCPDNTCFGVTSCGQTCLPGPTCNTCAETCATCNPTCDASCLDQTCTCSLYPNCPTDPYHEQCDG